jgi:hypothetical protein
VGERWKGLSRPEDLPEVDDLLGSFRRYDALCINQEDTQERNHQVSQMGRIYGEADCVITWLGPLTPRGGRESSRPFHKDDWAVEIPSNLSATEAARNFSRTYACSNRSSI